MNLVIETARANPLTCPHWTFLRPRTEDCDCNAPEMAKHSSRCSVTPIYAKTFADTNQPDNPWSWPWLAMDMAECWCEENCEPSDDCTIHGTWLARYAARFTR